MSETSVVRSYLLGELADDRSAALEEALLADGDLLALLEEAERDLIDDYVRHRLSADENERFNRHYLVGPLHRDRVVIARILHEHAGQAAGVPWPAGPDVTIVSDAGWLTRIADAIGLRSRVLGWATAAVAVAIAGGLAVALWRGTVSERTPTPTAAVAPPSGSLPAPDPPAGSAPANAMRVALVLPALSPRSPADVTPRISIARGVEVVDLLIEGARPGLADAAATVRSIDDRVAWTGRSAPPPSTAHAAIVSVPAARLMPDDYILTLADSTGASIARYFFRVAR